MEKGILYEAVFGIVLESFFDLCGTLYLNFSGLNPDYTFIGEVFGAALSLMLVISMLAILPYGLIWLIFCSDEESRKKNTKVYGYLYADIKTEEWSARVYYLVFMLFRIAFMSVAKFLDTLIYQFIVTNTICLAYCVYLIRSRPWQVDTWNSVEIIFEIAVLFHSYLLILFTDLTDDSDRNYFGYIFVGSISLFMAITLIAIILGILASYLLGFENWRAAKWK